MRGRSFSADTQLYRRNAVFPMLVSSSRIRTAVLYERAERALMHYVSTKRGSVWSDPDYGTLLYTLRTQGITKTRDGQVSVGGSVAIVDDIRSGVQEYVPIVEAANFTLSVIPGSQTLTLNIYWTLSSIWVRTVDVAEPKKTQVVA